MRWTCDCGNRKSVKIGQECPECGQVNPKLNKMAVHKESLDDLPFIIEVSEGSRVCGQCTYISPDKKCPNCGHLIEEGETLPYDPKRVRLVVLANG